VPEETEPSCLDERQQLRWRASLESYIGVGNMSCVENPYDTSDTAVVEGGNPVFQSSGQGPCFGTVENVYSVQLNCGRDGYAEAFSAVTTETISFIPLTTHTVLT